MKYLNVWLYRLLFAFLILLIASAALIYVSPYSVKELNLYALKYTQMNISQNSGLHKFALKAIQKFAKMAHQPEVYRKSDSFSGVGSSPEQFQVTTTVSVTLVNSTKQLLAAIKNAQPGQTIIISPGVYRIKKRAVPIRTNGSVRAPIVLAARQLGDVTLEMDSLEGLHITAKHWQIKNLIFRGVKGKDGSIEHAIHIARNADFVQIINNRFINFNSHIKTNGARDREGLLNFPDGLLVANNDIYNEWKRNTRSPASPIDIVGGDNVVVKNNFIADFGKYGRRGYGITYGAFMKGGGKNGVFENNVVMCEWRVPHTSPMDVRIGLSFGNGGTGGRYCADGKCDYEHINGVMRNNTVLNCVNDVGIYLNKSKNTLIENNAVRSSLGIDVRFPASNAVIRGNIIEGRIKSRDEATISPEDNIIE